MHPLNRPARAVQRLTYFPHVKVCHYWPIDRRDQQSNQWRVTSNGIERKASLDGNKECRIVYGTGTVPTAGFTSDEGGNDFVSELQGVWAVLGQAPGELFFGEATGANLGVYVGAERGMRLWNPNTHSYLMFCSWITETDKTGGMYIDYFNDIQTQMWMTNTSGDAVGYKYSSQTVNDADDISISHTATAGRVIRAAMLWDHVNKEHSAWLRDGSDAPDTPAAVAKAGQTTPQNTPMIGFRYNTCQYYGGAVIELDAECTNAFTVADAVMADWEAGKKDLTGLSALEFA